MKRLANGWRSKREIMDTTTTSNEQETPQALVDITTPDDIPSPSDKTSNSFRDATPSELEIVSAIENSEDELEALQHLRLIDDVLIRLKEGRMLVHMAAVKGYPALIEELLNRGAYASWNDRANWTPLGLASHHGYVEVVKVLLAHYRPAMINEEINDQSWPPLHHALQRGHLEVAFLLIRAGASIWVRTANDKMNAVERAALIGPEIVKRVKDEEVLGPALYISCHRYGQYHRFLSPRELEKGLETPYTYVPLRQIAGGHRLESLTRVISFMQIKTTTTEDKIVIQLQPCSKTECSYDAISYVWGEPIFNHKVLCDEGASHLNITKKLFQMLEILRPSNWIQSYFFTPKLWIDAICINQDDACERSSQVWKMAEIYRKADCVRVFLDTPSLQPQDCLQSKWWSRRWVIQEIVSAKQAIMHSGVPGCEWTPWANIAISCLQYARLNPQIITLDMQTTLSKIHELYQITVQQNGASRILDHLTNFHDTECQDDRDRLYSFFGISQDDINSTQISLDKLDPFQRAISSAQIRCGIDYEMSTSQLYIYFAQAALRSAHPMDLLHCAGAFRRATTVSLPSEFPSWVPDWRTTRVYQPLMRAISFRAGLSSPRKRITIGIDEVQLAITIPGIRVGVVKSTNEIYPDSIECITSVDYVRSGDIDMAIDRVGITVNTSSKSDIVGCAPPTSRAGDIVVVFLTARTPFILRLKDFQSFELVCDCYVQGFMQGEALKNVEIFEDFVII